MTSDDQVNAALEREAEFDRLELEVGASTAPYLRATTAERDRRVLAAEVRRCHARRCETCRHQSKGDGLKVCWHSPIKCTGPYKSIDLTHYPKCETCGGGCLAWEKRDA